MRTWLNNLRPEARNKIIFLESELAKCEEEIAEIDNLTQLNETGECLLEL